MKFSQSVGPVEGALAGVITWLGFVATTRASAVLFEKRPLGLYWINAGYDLISLALMGTILALI